MAFSLAELLVVGVVCTAGAGIIGFFVGSIVAVKLCARIMTNVREIFGPAD
ncbi:hypothetical protein [Henriciella sp.]|uniref:hypothetical protein n=1 Tax=Henriciella sp. TaxID=1968823 RepID=UPI0025C6D11F|nr:hypothetical protein [Henriciella sp.]